MKVKEKSEKIGLKLSIQKMEIMASSPITSWQIDGETMGKHSALVLSQNPTLLQQCRASYAHYITDAHC